MSEKVRLGGMALVNGVLVHGPTSWAVAVRKDDGTLKVAGERKRFVGSGVTNPLARGPLKLIEAFAFLPRVKRVLPEAKLPFERRGVIAGMVAPEAFGIKVMSHLVGNEPQKATIIARGTALGYVLHLPEEERYLETKEELLDWMIVALAGRAAEQVVFGRVTNGAASDLEKVTQIARSMVFEWGMGAARRPRLRHAERRRARVPPGSRPPRRVHARVPRRDAQARVGGGPRALLRRLFRHGAAARVDRHRAARATGVVNLGA